MTLDIWAPLATTVAIRIGSSDVPLTREAGDHWTTAATLAPGTDYGVVVDGADPVPDPRSRWQPDGVNGATRVFDADDFEWTDGAWAGRQLAGGVIYELHVGTFTNGGTLDASITRLDHLVSIGIDFVELLPVNDFDGSHNWGYDGVLWYAVHSEYGGPEAYLRFVNACHARGLAVIQDVVYNHLGPSGDYLPRFGPYLTDSSTTMWGASVNLESPEVRRYILDNAAMWLRDYHVDGLRLDAVDALVDPSATHILQQLAEETDALAAFLGRPLTLIAESDLNDPKLIMPREAGGYGLTAQWNDDFHHALHVALTGETAGYYADFATLGTLAKATTRGFFHDGTYSAFRGRDLGFPIDPAVPTWRLVAFAENHDQVGNRAVGDRLAASADAGQLAIAAVLTMAGPFTPMLFMGEEWGAMTPWQFFTSHSDRGLGRASADGRRATLERMGWDPDSAPDPEDPETFLRSKLDWSELDNDRHATVLALYHELAILRRTIPELTHPQFADLRATFDDETKLFRLDRATITILVNFSETSGEVGVEGEVLLTTSGSAMRLAPHSAMILRRSDSRAPTASGPDLASC
jgi:maltooligosyltrehalose trehalohydrolase